MTLTPEQLREFLNDLESDRVERTVSTTKGDKFAEAVCAFANDLPHHRQPGYLLVGVDDSGRPAGSRVTEQLLQTLAALRSDGNILPPPALAVRKVSLPEGEVAVVEVQPADLPPVRYKGRVWVRIGPRRGIATEQEERILMERRVATARTFDATPCPEAALDDLSLRLFDEYRAQQVDPATVTANHRTLEEQLASLRLFDLRDRCPTMVALLLLGINPRYFLPGAYVQFLRFPGTTLVDTPIDQAELAGDLRTLLDLLREKFRAHNLIGLGRGPGFTETTTPDYPEWAVREILHNAIMHRDYHSTSPVRFHWFADRIEILSPGGLYGEVTPDNFNRVNSYRNPVIAEAMKALGYVNRFGYGIQRAEAELARNGNPPLEFTFGTVVGVVLRGRGA